MKKRVFLAINLPEDVKKEIFNLSQKLIRRLPEKSIKFVEKENLHVTLHFIGDQTEAKIEEIIKVGEEVARNFSGFEVAINKLNAFPNINFPRIIVLGSERESEVLQDLRNGLGERLERIGIEIDKRPWEGHVTLARIKFGKVDFNKFTKNQIGEWRWMADGFDLVESKLTEDGPIYKILKHFSFYL